MDLLLRIVRKFQADMPENLSLAYSKIFNQGEEGFEVYESNGQSLTNDIMFNILKNRYPYTDLIYRLDNVNIDLKHGIVYKHNKVVDESSLVSSSAQYDSLLFNSSPKNHFARVENQGSDLYSPVSILSNNYYHWVTDSLPKIITIINCFPKIKFIALNDLPYYAQDFFNVTNTKILYSKKRYIKLNSVVFANSRNPFMPSATDAQIIKDYMFKKFELDQYLIHNKQRKKIFITRDQSTRYNLFEDHIFKVYEQKNFIKLRSEGIGIIETSKIFSLADEISGFHGAGLTNMIFLKKGSQVNEYTDGNYWSPVYLRMAQSLNLNYKLFKATSLKDPQLLHSTSTGV